MLETPKLEDNFTPKQLIKYLLEIEKQLASIGMTLKDKEYSMVGDIIIDASQELDQAVEIIKEFK